MPDNLALEVLKRFGINLPPPQPTPTQQDIDLQNQVAQRAQAQDPSWKKAIDSGLNGIVGLFKGATGLGNQGPAGPTATNLGALLSAGIPFVGHTPFGKVFHGTNQVYDAFNPQVNQIDDTLGAMTHFAEHPDYAANFAEGYKGFNGLHVKPAVLDVKNAIDLTRSRIMDPKDIGSLTNAWKVGVQQGKYGSMRHTWRPSEDGVPEFANSAITKDVLKYYPELLGEAGFDGVRYLDGFEPAWAIADPTLAKTPWGVPLGSEKFNKLPDLTEMRNRDLYYTPTGKNIPINTSNKKEVEKSAQELYNILTKPTPFSAPKPLKENNAWLSPEGDAYDLGDTKHYLEDVSPQDWGPPLKLTPEGKKKFNVTNPPPSPLPHDEFIKFLDTQLGKIKNSVDRIKPITGPDESPF